MDTRTIHKLISEFDRKELIQLIDKLVVHNEDAEKQLLTFCQKVKPKQNKTFILEKQIQNAWHIAYEIIDMFNMYGGGPEDEEEEVFDQFDEIERLVKKEEISWEIRKDILDEMMVQINYDNSGFTDSLVEIAVVLCQQKEEKLYLADQLTLYGDSYYRKLAAQMYKDNGDKNKYLATLQENLEYATDYVDLAKFKQKEGKQEEALQIAWKGLEKSNGRLDHLYNFLFNYYQREENEEALRKLYHVAIEKKWNLDVMTKNMYNYYKKKGDISKQKEMLVKMVECTNNVRYWYGRCKKELKKEEFSQQEPHFVEIIKKKDFRFYLDLCIEKGQLDKVLSALQNRTPMFFDSIDENHKYSRQLVTTYPQEVLTLYWNEVNDYVRRGKRENYRHAVKVLREIRKIMRNIHQKEKWESQYREFRQLHKRKRLFMEALEKL